MSSSDDDDSGIDDEGYDVKNDLEGNPELEDSWDSTNGMVGKARRHASDVDFIDPNTDLRKPLHFVNPSGKKI